MGRIVDKLNRLHQEAEERLAQIEQERTELLGDLQLLRGALDKAACRSDAAPTQPRRHVQRKAGQGSLFSQLIALLERRAPLSLPEIRQEIDPDRALGKSSIPAALSELVKAGRICRNGEKLRYRYHLPTALNEDRSSEVSSELSESPLEVATQPPPSAPSADPVSRANILSYVRANPGRTAGQIGMLHQNGMNVHGDLLVLLRRGEVRQEKVSGVTLWYPTEGSA